MKLAGAIPGVLLAIYAFAQGNGAAVFAIRSDPAAWPHPEKQLEKFVAAKAARRENHFCAVGYRERDGGRRAWAWWREGNALILWDASLDPADPVSLLDSTRILHLDRDVVASSAGVHGSTYLVTRAWVDKVEKDCQEHGDRFVVRKHGRH